MLYDVGNRMLFTSWKLYVVRCGKSYVVTKLKIVCWTMWEVVCFYDIGNRMWEVVCLDDIGNRMLSDVGSHMLLRCWKLYVKPCGKSYIFTMLEVICCTMWEVVKFLRCLKSFVVPCGKWYVFVILEIVC